MRYSRYTFTLIVLLAIFSPAIHAQEKIPGAGFGIEANVIAGQIFKHTPKFKPPVPSLSTACDLAFCWQTYGTKDWQQRLKFPLVGFGLTYVDYGIDSIYGRSLGLYPFLQIPIIRGKKLEWTMRMGFGACLVSRYYKRGPVWDTLNNAIGSELNNFSVFMTDLRYHINHHWDISLGANFSHMSNATYHQPNLGVNMYGAHIGVRYFPVTSQPEKIIRNLQPLSNRWLFQGRFSMAFTESNAPNGPLYHVYLATLYMSRRWHSKNKFFAGLDYSYHQDIYAFLKNNEIDAGSEAQHSWKSAVIVGNEFGVGHFGIILQIGVYIHEAALVQDPYYEKIGAQYYLLQREHGAIKELFLSGLLKTHKTNAELAEFGIGFGL